jgi:hypothetical protein
LINGAVSNRGRQGSLREHPLESTGDLLGSDPAIAVAIEGRGPLIRRAPLAKAQPAIVAGVEAPEQRPSAIGDFEEGMAPRQLVEEIEGGDQLLNVDLAVGVAVHERKQASKRFLPLGFLEAEGLVLVEGLPLGV